MFDPEAFHDKTGLTLTNAEALDATSVTPTVYSEWRAPRFGGFNPEVMNNPLWEWMVKTGIAGYSATQRFKGPSPFDEGPAWCFDRMGQTCTILPDGRRVFIAGEHEDYYDPDFCIYNDVVVWHPNGRLEIFGYPREVFPPTDFHTATLVNGCIVIIGNLGYSESRVAGKTQVARLNIESMEISLVATTGVMPGWLHRHKAELTPTGDKILVRGGYTEPVVEGESSVENLSDWSLSLHDWHWEIALRRDWRRFEVRRVDQKNLQHWALQRALLDSPWGDSTMEAMIAGSDAMREVMASSRSLWEKQRQKFQDTGISLDKPLFESLYRPTIRHEFISDLEEFEDEYPFKVHRVRVDGVIVRFVDENSAIHITFEGDLPPETSRSIVEHVRSKLELIQSAPCESKTI